MKLVTFRNPAGEERSGWIHGNGVVDMNKASGGKLPVRLLDLLNGFEAGMDLIRSLHRENIQPTHSLPEVTLLAPIPKPPSVRDFVSFETHIQNATRRTNQPMPQEWYEIPVFYFTNHHAIVGPDQPVQRPRKCAKLDYELELACVIGKEGRNIKASDADDYIAGYMIFNDWTARDLQAQEMKVNLGPAKGKDFATATGPYLVTKDELEPYRVNDRYDLEMKAFVNGKLLSQGNFKTVHYTFAQMIERASEDTTLYPGDVIGSGTVGFGCLLELGPETHRWLEPGDEVELTITGLGSLRNRVI
ncbi:fumarylacetoacetate hydrolase family protein [Paenibacillus sp.]|uniref:fumarylacetoacetate hydrolase family protein n=1 Tax=Paenibacillus sp. TaxID=58172 RepID=UPI002D7507D3|nr:fumarylacetoacetate hydrolase family protein [Paenibacillus sp.]HZG84049.1 fumarylacetoacetate hydrolase family protein [Paenibacillus sp.]